MKPFFSIIIPTFNQSNFLKKCLLSVFAQNYKNFEVIVIDNFSTDNTKKIIKNFEKKIIYKKIKNNGIIAKSRNNGMKIANGNWIAFLDSDDTWSQNKLSEVSKIIEKKNFEVICNGEYFVKNKNIKINICGPYEKNFYKKLIITGNRLSTSASIVNKGFVKKNKIMFNENKKFISSEDYCFFLDIAKNGARFFFSNKILGFHQFHKKSISSNLLKHIKAEEEVLKFHIFKLQKFTKNKNKLLIRAIRFREIRKNLIFLTKNLTSFKIFFRLINLFLKSPMDFIYCLKLLTFKKIDELKNWLNF